ncbi:3-methyl-2-oxobutanoate hydroxymethyltransferase [Streptomyces thermocarboxydus]
MWPHPLEIRFDELLVVAKAVRRGVADALVSCDFPFGPLQTGHAVPAAVRLAKEAGVDLVKLDGAADFPKRWRPSHGRRAGLRAVRHHPANGAEVRDRLFRCRGAFVPDELLDEMVDEARRLESAGRWRSTSPTPVPSWVRPWSRR